MMHARRVWRVGPPTAGLVALMEGPGPELASSPLRRLAWLLTSCWWPSCTGFRLGPYAYLCDQTSPDGAGEWGIVRLADGQQLESVTFGWMATAEAEAYLRRVHEHAHLETAEHWRSVGRFLPRVPLSQLCDDDDDHKCIHCR